MDLATSDPTPPKAAVSKNASAQQIVRNTLMGYATSALMIFTGLIVTPLLVRRLGTEQFGLWALLSSAIAWLALIDLGISTTLVKRVAEHMAADDHKRLNELVQTAQFLFCVAALLVMVAGALLAILIGPIFHLSPQFVHTARITLLVLTLNQAAMFIGIVQTAVVIGMGRLDILGHVGLGVGVFVALGNLAAVFGGVGVTGLAAVAFTGTLVTMLVLRMILKRQLAEVRFSPRFGSWSLTRSLIKSGSGNAVVAFAGSLAQGADTLIVGAFFPVAVVGQYAVASKIANMVRTLAAKPIEVLMPTYSHSYALGEHDRLRRLFIQSITISMTLIIPGLISMWVFGREILRLWVGAGHEASYGIGVVLLLALTLQLPGHACFIILTGTEKLGYIMKVAVAAGAANFLLSIVLTALFGPVGVAWAP